MAGAHLYGWYGTLPSPKWVKLVCDADGKLILDPDSKYTDENARAACKLSGSVYWSCPGVHFLSAIPATDNILRYDNGSLQVVSGNIYLRTGVFLPDGSTVTGAIVYGNAGAGDSIWRLQRIKLSDKASVAMSGSTVNSEDTTIVNATIDNSLYAYLLVCQVLVTNDEIWGARITYII